MRINAVLLSYVGCNPTLSDGHRPGHTPPLRPGLRDRPALSVGLRWQATEDRQGAEVRRAWRMVWSICVIEWARPLNPIGRRSSGVSGADGGAGTRQCSTGGWPRRRCRRRSPSAVASRFSPPCRAWRRANLAETAARRPGCPPPPRKTGYAAQQKLKAVPRPGERIACNATTDFNRSGNPPRVALTEVGI